MVGRHGVVADTLNRDCAINPKEDAANARLIAASPKMLAALIEVAEWMRDSAPFPPRESVRAALVEAIGEGEAGAILDDD